MKPELISFKLCPFVQRAAILLLEKAVDFDITFIDLKQPPDWFQEISPSGKVPLLRVDEKTVLFESAVITEYLNETYPPSLHPADALRRAHNRMWIEYNSGLNSMNYALMQAKDKAAFDQACATMTAAWKRVEAELGDGPYFNGATFSLIDTAYAPTLQRSAILAEHFAVDTTAGLPKLARLRNAYRERPCVVRSTVDDFDSLFIDYIKSFGGYVAQARRT